MHFAGKPRDGDFGNCSKKLNRLHYMGKVDGVPKQRNDIKIERKRLGHDEILALFLHVW